MSKNFEQAYKELAQKETPDLWDRIEAGLTEKSAPKKTDISKDIGKDIQKQIVSDKPDEQRKNIVYKNKGICRKIHRDSGSCFVLGSHFTCSCFFEKVRRKVIFRGNDSGRK